VNGAEYLLRFDDLCPTVNWPVWNELERILCECKIRPIIAVVPDNRDSALAVQPPDPHFWQRVRDWQSLGWCIGLHGYQHTYVTRNPGVIGLNKRSEFAGLPYEVQREKIASALAIFAAEDVAPRAWVAPGHSFDQNTLRALLSTDIRVVSDGFFVNPARDAAGFLWVPQQLWRFRRMPFGLWTVCFHINSWSLRNVTRFAQNIDAFRSQIVSLDDVVSRTAPLQGIGHAVGSRLWRSALVLKRAWSSHRASRPGSSAGQHA
jgi:predicted deacetylase